MGLKIVYGRAGYGKSTYILNSVKSLIKENIDTRIYIITPEQFSFTLEKKLLDMMDNGSSINAEVLTFNRMAYRVFNEVGGAVKTNLTSYGKAMIIYNILLENKNKLKFIGKSEENVELISTQFTEFKKHGIKDLDNIINTTDDMYLKTKLKDMSLLYNSYNAEILNKYIDENDILTILLEKIDASKAFDNSVIYIDEFVGFTYQEYEIIRKLLKKAREVIVTVCSDNLSMNDNKDIDIFYSSKETAQKLIDIANEENVKIESPLCVAEKNNRFKNDELKHLEENIYAPLYSKFNGNNSNIEIFLANNQYSEIEEIAQKIVKLIINDGYRYREISIITKNLDRYSSLAKAIFEKYNIPIFIDEKKELNQNILIKFITSLIDIFAKNWSYEAVFGYIKTGLLNLDKDNIYVLENYCLKWGIRGAKWYNSEWEFFDETEEEIQKINYTKNIVLGPLLEFKNNFSREKTVREITIVLYDFLIKNGIIKKLEKKINHLNKIGKVELAKEYETSYKILIEVLDEYVLVLGDQKVSFDKYSKILKVGLKNSSLGKIPGTIDQVTMGDVDRSRNHKVRAVFIIGLNDGSFPSVNKDEGFFNDNDRLYLKENGVELAKTTVEKLYDDNLNIYKAFTTAEEKIFLSYASSDSEGKSLRPSTLINKIKRIFPNIKEQSDIIKRESEVLLKNSTYEELLVNLRDFINGEKIDNIWFNVYNYYYNNEKEKLESDLQSLIFKNIPDKINKENIEKLYGNTLKTSISKLEKYKPCAFSYYIRYGLKLSEKNNFKIEAIDTGNFMHEIIDTFFSRIDEMRIKVKEISDEQIEQITRQIVEEKLTLKKYYIFNSIPKYRILAQRLKKVIVKSMKYIVYTLKYSDFEVLGHEIEFNKGKQYEPIVLELNNGKKVEITGKIDRVDIAKTTDGNYIRIIDYKSSIKNIDLNEVVAGLQLQLLTYLDATCKIENMLPAGVLYFNLIDPIINSNKNLSEDQIEAEIRKQFKMQGLILADINIVKKMDKTLTSGNSDIIPAYINKEGELSNKPSNINAEQFEYLQKYMDKIIKQISEEILSGDIEIKPYYNTKNKKTPCEYCAYRSICRFNQITKNDYRYIPNMDKDVILGLIKENKI